MANFFEELQDENEELIIEGTSVTAESAELLRYTRDHRAYMGTHGYPQPPRWVSMLYALQELGEFIDALVTRPLADQKRNNAKNLDAIVELGDTLEMLNTSLLSEDDIDDLSDEEERMREIIGQACYFMGSAVLSYNVNAIHQAINRVAKLAELAKTTPTEALLKSHDKTRAKHGPKEQTHGW